MLLGQQEGCAGVRWGGRWQAGEVLVRSTYQRGVWLHQSAHTV